LRTNFKPIFKTYFAFSAEVEPYSNVQIINTSSDVIQLKIPYWLDAVNDHQSSQLLIPSCQQRLHCRRQNIFFSALVSLYKKKQFGQAYDAIDVRKQELHQLCLEE